MHKTVEIRLDDLIVLTQCATAWVAQHQTNPLAAECTEAIKRVGELKSAWNPYDQYNL